MEKPSNHAWAGPTGVQFLDQVEAMAGRQGQVHDDEVRMVRVHLGEGDC